MCMAISSLDGACPYTGGVGFALLALPPEGWTFDHKPETMREPPKLWVFTPPRKWGRQVGLCGLELAGSDTEAPPRLAAGEPALGA
jgi:hypothetical protein